MSRRQRKRELLDMRSVMEMDQGMNFLFRILDEAGLFNQSFTPGMPESTAFLEGKRSIANWLWNELEEADRGRLFEFMKTRMEPLDEETETGDNDD